MPRVRRLTAEGIKTFHDYLVSPSTREPPAALLSDPSLADHLDIGVEVGDRVFRSRMELGRYLRQALTDLRISKRKLTPTATPRQRCKTTAISETDAAA